jgi:hemerythrin-like domain-containing protein/CBS domain-containing protein
VSNALSSLIREHQLIAALTAALDVYANAVDDDTPVEAEDLGRFARVFNDFADAIHHEKEESILLPFLSHHGFDWESEILKAVRQEHRQERYLVAVLCQAGTAPASWSTEYRRQITAAARALSAFQRKHHQRENEELFPAVLAQLNAEALTQLQSELVRFDDNPHHRALRAAAEDLAYDLIQRYRPTGPVEAPRQGEASRLSSLLGDSVPVASAGTGIADEQIMIVREVMSSRPITVGANESIGCARATLRETHIRHLPVVDRGRLVGIVSDRDIPVFDPEVASLHEARIALNQPTSSIMSRNLILTNPESDLTQVIDLMIEHTIGVLPVVDRESLELVGIVSYVDVLRAARHRL